MKKILALICAAMMIASMEAKVIMTESFERAVGTLNMGTDKQMGTNTDDWWSYSGGTGTNPKYVQVAEGSLSYPGYVTTGKGNKAYIWSTDADDFRKFTKEYTSGKVYLAAIINVEELRQGTNPDYFLSLGDGGISKFFGRAWIRSVKEGDSFIGFQLGIGKYTENETTIVPYTDKVYEPQKNHLVVIEYEFVDGDKNDVVRLYVNPTKSTTKPTLVCDQDGAGTKDDASKIGAVYLRQARNVPRQVYVDEIKVATAWEDLFEDGDVPVVTDPVIEAASSVNFGDVNIDEAAEKSLTVSGSNLLGAISVASDNAALVPTVTSISKADAEAGFSLTLTLTAPEAGSGSASIILSSEGADSKTVSVEWNALAPAGDVLTIAQVKQQPEDSEVALNDVVVVRRFQDGLAFSVQDATGALNIADYYGLGERWEVGDRISGLTGFILPSAEGLDGFCTIFPMTGTVTESEVALEPFAVSLNEFNKYGPALIQVTGVTFPEEVEKFAAGGITISQNAASANLQIPEGCDIIGEDVPESADVKGVVCHPYFSDNILIEESADVFNRVPRGGGDIPVYENLILNPSFEEYKTGSSGIEFSDWTMAFGGASANSTDKLEGNVSLYMNPTTIATALDQGVLLLDNEYAAGSKFRLILNYKVLSMPEGKNLALDCYWEAAAGGDSEAAKAHDADILQVNLENGSGWTEIDLTTTKPAKTSYFRVRFKLPKNAKVLFDKFSMTYLPSDEPFIEVTPQTLAPFSVTIGNTETKTVHIRQGNLSANTTFYIGGEDRDQFQLSATELPAGQTDLDLIITYAPTSAGTHTASLIFDNAAHTTILPDLISLTGNCTDPSATPVITLDPMTLPDFEVMVGQQQTMTVTLNSINCTEYVHARVDHISPEEHGAFTIDGSFFSPNIPVTVTITFAPKKEGSFQSTVTFYTTGSDNVVLTLNGTATPKTPETIDWQTEFVWDDSNPLALLIEPFDDITHGETFLKNGWQNVAGADERPWQGVDASKMMSITGDGKFVRASAFQSGLDSTDLWEMWLVTPALDYKNAESKIFAFSVMGMYLPEDGNSSTHFEVYYIDASGNEVFFQDLTGYFDIPTSEDEKETWRTFYLDLTGQENIADVFHIGFRYVGPNGEDGIVTYYVDDVSWGRTDLPTIHVTPNAIIDSAVVNEKTEIATLTITTSNIEGALSLSLAGANYNRFSLSQTSLPAEGGEVVVSFEGEEIGVHEAYVVISSEGAPDVYVPMAIKCKDKETGLEEILSDHVQSTKVLIDGHIYILRDRKAFNLLGSQVK